MNPVAKEKSAFGGLRGTMGLLSLFRLLASSHVSPWLRRFRRRTNCLREAFSRVHPCQGCFASVCTTCLKRDGARLATVANSSLHHICAALLRSHPDILLSIRDGTAALVTNLVEQGVVEFGITTQLTFGPSIQAESLGHYGFNLILAPGSEASKLISRKSVDWQELKKLKFVGLNPLSSTRLQLDGALESLGLHIPWKVEVDQLSTLLSMVRNAGYASVLPTLFDCGANGFKGIPIRRPTLTRELFLIRRPDSRRTDAGAAFVQLARSLIHGVKR
ncbi:hypothetical protein JNX00_06970 [Hydrogenophaga sp. YM1]|uniref:LysR substrate-binding domain-containing protein n=1 Tax=Hydrogenophaga sp. YM1 TaxID=2806262 RepID=UPI00195BA977|nr:LysR substrate-binding domain-containing protein [Hydrogenophaga sp. YM1]QRR35600.1 hypothetical protein JNX00_06970 [Hydrogenophaga sp. YM1]